ncbi:MAG: hypothetical protein OEY34_10490, partial [Cyclobacteriaceae bacterium]|nr:hypothetical protein [Cyclobacteriaceae bacterium]
ISNIHGELNYNKEDKYRVIIRGDYYKYSSLTLEHAWHKPEYKISVLGSFNIVDKIRLTLDNYFIGGIVGNVEDVSNPGEWLPENLKTAMDINLHTDYLMSPRFTIFLQLNNILSTKYELYRRYPVRGFQALGGISYKF